MTKTLTEQWREGTLPAGCYYVLSTEDDTPVACDIDTVCDFMIRDVIAPVPTYDEYKELVFKANKPANPLSDCMMTYDTEREKEIVAPLLEQLKEANELIKDYGDEYPNVVCDYLKKWGVK